MCKPIIIITVFVAFFFDSPLAYGVVAPSSLAPELFKSEDTVCFVGDSITHSGFYHTYIYNYYITRFPDKKIKIYNCGIGGHTTEKTLVNFTWDVPKKNPTIVYIMLGMNDLRVDKPRMDHYIANLKALIHLIKKTTSARIVLMSPTPYDEFLDTDAEKRTGFNATLADSVVPLRTLAQESGATFIDLHSPMTEILRKGQKNDPQFTIIGQDRIHPGPVGNLIMTYLILKAQGAAERVNEVVIDANSQSAAAYNGTLSNISITDQKIEFDLLSQSVPFVMAKSARSALDLVGFHEELNREMLQITGLPQAIYLLRIDQKPIGEYTAAQLNNGINLAINEKTPQYQQSQQIAAFNTIKREWEFQLNTESKIKVDLQRHGFSFDGKTRGEVYDLMESQKATDLFRAGAPFSTGGIFRYWKRYQMEKESLPQLELQLPMIVDLLYTIAQPGIHHYIIEKYNASGSK